MTGFSLIELLFAMTFLSVIVFGVIRLQTSNLTLSNTKQLELKAYAYANQAMEVAEAIGYNTLRNCTVPCYLDENGGSYSIENNGAESLENGLFERTISHVAPGLVDALYVTSRVEWEDSAGEHRVSVERVIFD